MSKILLVVSGILTLLLISPLCINTNIALANYILNQQNSGITIQQTTKNTNSVEEQDSETNDKVEPSNEQQQEQTLPGGGHTDQNNNIKNQFKGIE